MKRLPVSALVLSTLLFTGCLVRTSMPWLTDESKVMSPSLAGTWQDAGQQMTVFFTQQGSNYQVRVNQAEKGVSVFSASLHAVDNTLLLVVGPAGPASSLEAFVQSPVYLLFKCVMTGGTLQLFTLNLDAAPDRVRTGALAPALTGGKENGFLLVAPTADLTAFVRAQLNSPDFFQTKALFAFSKLSATPAPGAPAAAP